jgi:chromosome segregation ATPase
MLEQQHEAALQDVNARSELDKKQFIGTFEKEQIESKNSLELSEQALVESKRHFFTEKEKTQETIDVLQLSILDLEKKVEYITEDGNARKMEFQKINDRLQDEIDELLARATDANRKLEVKTRELLEIEGLNDLELKSVKQEYETKIVSLDQTIYDLQTTQTIMQEASERLKMENTAFEQEISSLNRQISELKEKSTKSNDEAQESLFEATDQLERVQRLLRDVNNDVDRYRNLANERDQEVLNIKRQVVWRFNHSFGQKKKKLLKRLCRERVILRMSAKS